MSRTQQPPPQVPAPLAVARLVSAHDQLGWLYDLQAPVLRRAAHAMAVARAAPRDGERLLEVGVGSGPTFVALAGQNAGGENVGIDLCAAMLSRCRARLARAGLRNFRLEKTDARAMPFAPASFDLLLCCFVLDALDEPDQQRVLEGFLHVLCPGGRLVLTQMTHGGLALYDRIAAAAPRVLGGCRAVRLGPRLLEVGFRDVSQIPYRRLGFAWELVRAVKP